MPTYAEIRKQIAQLEKKAAEARKGELGKVIANIKRQIAEFGLTAADLGLAIIDKAGGRSRRAVAKSPPKYQDPKTGKTWTGRGKPPLWIAEATKKGRRDDYLIERVSAGAKPAAKKAALPKSAPAGAKAAAPKKGAVAKKAVPAKGAARKPSRPKTERKQSSAPVAEPPAASAPATQAPEAGAA